MELRHNRVYFRSPGEALPLTRGEWRRTYVCLGGLRLGVVNRHGPGRGVQFAWRWSWKGTEIDVAGLRLFAGWMAPQFRGEN